MCILLYIIFLALFNTKNCKSIETFDILTDGGYTAHICFNASDENLSLKQDTGENVFSCNKSDRSQYKCINSMLYSCHIPCQIKAKHLKIKTKISVNYKSKPKFKLSNIKLDFQANDNLTINDESKNGNLSLLMIDEINVEFSTNISCSKKYITNKSLICQLNLSQIASYDKQIVNVSISYGYTCNIKQFIGNITVKEHIRSIGLWIASILLCIVLLGFLTLFLKTYKNGFINNRSRKQKHGLSLEKSFNKIQFKTFCEYQMAMQSLKNIGKLTNRHLHSFHDFMSKLFNIKLKLNFEEKMTDELDSFKSILLNKEMLTNWIDQVENNCGVRDRCIVSYFLTLYLFYYPQYFIDVMKTLLRRLVIKMKKNSEEKILFCKSEYIVEKMISYWITLCLYQSLKKTDIGEKFFNLCRGIKCKIDSGVVDMFTNNAKFALSFEHLLMDDFTAKQITINVDVNINIQLMNLSNCPLEIDLDNLEVDVLTLDTISQVKLKIIDKAIVTFCEIYTNVYEFDSSIAPINHKEFTLQSYFSNNLINYEDFDATSKTSNNNKSYILANTIKHYNIDCEMKLFLKDDPELILNVPKNTSNSLRENEDDQVLLHIQIPQNINVKDRKELYFVLFEKLLSDSFIENANKDPYLFTLLATKQSLDPLICSFIESIIHRHPKMKPRSSINFIYNEYSEPEYTNNVLYGSNSSLKMDVDDDYLKLAYFLFTMLDEIGNSLSIDQEIIQSWKIKSYILQVWVNLIKNPDFIFSFEKTTPIYGSLITIAKVLMESGSKTINTSPDELEFQLIKQLFKKDIEDKYSVWWKSFLKNSLTIEEDDIVSIISDCTQKNFLNGYKTTALSNLHLVSKTMRRKSVKI